MHEDGPKVYALVGPIEDADTVEELTGEDGFGEADESEQHAFRPLAARSREVEIDPEDFRERWSSITSVVKRMFDDAEPVNGSGPLHLDSVTVELTLTAKGKLALLAEASASASISVVFKRVT